MVCENEITLSVCITYLKVSPDLQGYFIFEWYYNEPLRLICISFLLEMTGQYNTDPQEYINNKQLVIQTAK